MTTAVGRLADAAIRDFSSGGILRELREAAAVALGGTGTAVAVMAVRESAGSACARVAHSDEQVTDLERLQEELQQGPCRDAVDWDAMVTVTDIAAQQQRWPQFAAEASALGLRAVAAVPLRARGRVWGVLDLYRTRARAWPERELAVARLLADVAASYLVMASDRDAAYLAHLEIEHRSMHDQLTGLPNRSVLHDRIEHALATATRRDRVLAVAFLDLDRFKEVNDTFGHAAGDDVLIEITRRINATLRAGDTLARLAGDEFVLLCEDLPAKAPELDRTVAAITARLRAALSQPVRVAGEDLVVSASIGIAVSHAGPSAQELLQDADVAMYAAKERGRNTVVVRDHTRGATVGFGRRLQRDLGKALESGQLLLHYQPILDATDERIEAVEALLRWQHPEHGLLTAQQFIHHAGCNGFLSRLAAWVVETACAQLATWRRELGESAPRVIFCNVGPRELADPALREAITISLSTHELKTADIGLEVLEDAFADPALASVLGDYSCAGHPLAVDDFGTGYSSLSRIIGLPVSYAKIDQSFVAGLPDDARCRSLLNAVLTVAGSLDLRVIAEGVETEAQKVYLTGAGCHLLQGYHLARPQTVDDVTRLVTHYNRS
ncbi:putative bifunctional diguanylate cyclase/phosphodiesterase [Kineococcus xinjiangensis]|uniref:putative bifunctional diguanylate cyclase/phosphodiesterase n=1 Tax=Kineococcus xinjiangensis TaxID=512762 RepID=UPI001304A223|nr:EAL domain-containing protein [Kineococcus xinjiangensis]